MKKKLVLIIVVAAIIGLLYVPVSEYLKTLQVYYKFYSKITPSTDSIFFEPKRQEPYFPPEFNEQARLFYLCKIWGFVKYHAEDRSLLADMDSLLMAAIPKAISATDKEDFSEVLKAFISPALAYHSTGSNPYQNLGDYILIDDRWITDTLCLYRGIKADLDTIWKRHTGKTTYFAYNKSNTGNIRLNNEPAYLQFPHEPIRLLGLFRYWNLINYFYVYKNHIEGSWDKVLYDAIPIFRAADNKEKYHRAIYRLTNQLMDTHASYPATVDDVVFGPYRPNFRMLLVDSTFIINKIRLSEHNDNTFRVGDRVLKVDHQDIYALSDSLNAYVCGGNYWSNQFFLTNAVLSRRDSTTLFTIVRAGDTLSVRSRNHRVKEMFLSEREEDKDNEKNTLYRWINDGIAYFDLRSATPDNFSRNYKPIKSASAIILDLRCYPNTNLILNLTDAFVPPNSFFAYVTYPDTRFPGMARYMRSSSGNIGSKDYFKGHVIVLVNEWTRSFSEYTAMALQANPKTITVGSSSSGSDGNVSIFEFPGEVASVYTGIGIYYPDFTPTQRAGVKIDYVVEPTIASIERKIDLAYETAIEIAKQKNHTKESK